MAAKKPAFRVLDESEGEPGYSIQPKSIALSSNLFAEGFTLLGRFGKAEVEYVAACLLRFFQHKRRWCSFSIEELRDWYLQNELDPNKMFFGLMGVWFDDGGLGGWREPPEVWLAITADGRYRVTNLFVKRCAGKLTIGKRQL